MNHSRFVIQNDTASALIVNIEPECVQVALTDGEKLTVGDRFENEPVTLKIESNNGETIISVWPGDGEVRVEKDGVDVFEIVENPTSPTPPTFCEHQFTSVDTIDEAAIKQRFNPLVRELHSYLNGLACLRDVQQARRRWKARVIETEAFGNFNTEPQHWYTFNNGGRNEAQFNVGMCPSYLRVGLGFEFTLREYGDPAAVQLAYACFRKVIQGNRHRFERFVGDNQLEIEWADEQFASLEFVATDDVVDWILNRLNPLRDPGWIFIGRLLRRGQDTAVLEDPVALGTMMQAVLCGFRPFWEQTQVMAYTP